jgi:hypothetical protein
MALQHLRSSTANKRPTPAAMSDGQLALNTNLVSPGLFFKDSNGDSVKVGPVHVGTTAPNATPGAGGQAGNSKGEQWLDTSSSRYVFKIWDGTAWRTEDGEFVNVSGDTMTGALGIIAGTAAAPGVFFSGDTNTGIYSPGADQVAVATNGVGRLFVDASGNIFQGGTQTGFQTGPGGSLSKYISIQSQDATTTQGLWLLNQDATLRRRAAFALDPVNNVAGLYTASSSGAAADLVFVPGASERLRITSAGLVGIGTSAPDVGLHYRGDTPKLRIESSNTLDTVAGTEEIGRLEWEGFRNTNFNAAASIRARQDGTWSTTTTWFSPSALEFYTQNNTGVEVTTPRMLIDSSGNVGIGITSPTEGLHTAGPPLFEHNSSAALYIKKTTTGTESRILFSNTADTKAAQMRINWAAQTFGAFEAWVPANASNGQSIAFEAGRDSTIFYTSSTERARIDSSGRLLVGTSTALTAFFGTPVNKLAIGGGAAPQVIGCYAANQFGPRLDFIKSRSATVNGQAIVSIGDGLGELYFGGSDGTAPIPAARIICQVDGTPGTNDMPGRLMFDITADGASSPTERMRISSDGNCTSFTSSNNTIRTARTSAADSAFVILNGASSVSTGTAVAIIRADGDLENTNNSYGALSDLKLKENIVDATSQWDDLKTLQVRKYNFKEDTGYATHTQIGLVAQEVELVSPGLVSESPDRDDEGNDLGTVTKSVNYSVLYMKAVKALQEAMERIEQLETGAYGSIGLEAPEDNIIPYADLTPEIVIGWVQDKLNVEEIETALQAQLDQQRTPTTAAGVPWS